MKISPINNHVVIQIKEKQEVNCCYKNKIILWTLFIFGILGVIIFFIACGHEFCPGTGLNSSRHSPPPLN
jgi:hypothetical protein